MQGAPVAVVGFDHRRQWQPPRQHHQRRRPSTCGDRGVRRQRHEQLAQLLEAMSQDLGNIAAGFNDNFAYGTLKLTANTYVELVDKAANSPGSTPEAVMSTP